MYEEENEFLHIILLYPISDALYGFIAWKLHSKSQTGMYRSNHDTALEYKHQTPLSKPKSQTLKIKPKQIFFFFADKEECSH